MEITYIFSKNFGFFYFVYPFYLTISKNRLYY